MTAAGTELHADSDTALTAADVQAKAQRAVVLSVNCLIESGTDAGDRVVRRLLFIDVVAREAALVDVIGPRAWPEWESFEALEEGLATGSLRVRADDPWFADTRPDTELTVASRKIRDERVAVIRQLVSLKADPDQAILRAVARGRLVREAHVATGKAEDKSTGNMGRSTMRSCQRSTSAAGGRMDYRGKLGRRSAGRRRSSRKRSPGAKA